MLKRVTSVAKRRKFLKESKRKSNYFNTSKLKIGKEKLYIRLLRRRILKITRKNKYLSKQNGDLKEMNNQLVKGFQEQKLLVSKLNKAHTEKLIEIQRLGVEENVVKEELKTSQELIRALENVISDIVLLTVSTSDSLAAAKISLSNYYSNADKKKRQLGTINFLANGAQRRCQMGTAKVVQEIAPMVQGFSIHKPFIALKRLNQEISPELPMTQREQDLVVSPLRELEVSSSSSDANPCLSPVVEENEENVRTPRIRLGRRGTRLLQRNSEVMSKPINVHCQTGCEASTVDKIASSQSSTSSFSPLENKERASEVCSVRKSVGNSISGNVVAPGTKKTPPSPCQDPLEGCSWMFKDGSRRTCKRKNKIKNRLYYTPITRNNDSSDEDSDYMVKHSKQVCNKLVLEDENKCNSPSTPPKLHFDKVPTVLCENLSICFTPKANGTEECSIDLSRFSIEKGTMRDCIRNINFKRRHQSFTGFTVENIVGSLRTTPFTNSSPNSEKRKSPKSGGKEWEKGNVTSRSNRRVKRRDIFGTSDQLGTNTDKQKSCVVLLDNMKCTSTDETDSCEKSSPVEHDKQLLPQARCSVSIQDICTDQSPNNCAFGKQETKKAKGLKMSTSTNIPTVLIENSCNGYLASRNSEIKTHSLPSEPSSDMYCSQENVRHSGNQIERMSRSRGKQPVYTVSLRKKLRRD